MFWAFDFWTFYAIMVTTDYQYYCGWFIINHRCIKKKQLAEMPKDIYTY